MASKRQIEANRRNAQKSTGPKTPEGRAAVRYNALRHGLTAQHAVLSDEEDEEFQEIVTAFQDDYRPVGPAEILLVQQMSMAAWRLQRIRGMETGLLDLRLWHFKANMRDGYTNPLEPNQRHAYVFLDDVRGPNALATLSVYEARAERSFYKALHEIQRLQARRGGEHVPPPAIMEVDVTVSGPNGSEAPLEMASSPANNLNDQSQSQNRTLPGDGPSPVLRKEEACELPTPIETGRLRRFLRLLARPAVPGSSVTTGAKRHAWFETIPLAS